MKTKRTKRAVWPLALVSAALMLACQDQGLEPVGPEGLGILLDKGPIHDHGGGTKVTWSFADLVVHPDVPVAASTLQSTCPGLPGAKTSNPTVEWKNGVGNPKPTNEGCVMVTPARTDDRDPVPLTNDASLIVSTKKGNTMVKVQFSIQDKVGSEGIQYRTDSFTIDLGPGFTGFEGAGSILHLHATDIPIWMLKGHTGGPKVGDPVGTINISDIVYRH